MEYDAEFNISKRCGDDGEEYMVVSLRCASSGRTFLEVPVPFEHFFQCVTGRHTDNEVKVDLDTTYLGKVRETIDVLPKDYEYDQNKGYVLINKKLINRGFESVSVSQSSAKATRYVDRK